VRPVAIGECDKRAIGRTLNSLVQAPLVAALVPQQVAVGVKGGISILIFGIRLLAEQRGDFVIVKIDLKNAFNAVDRASLLRRVHETEGLGPLMPLLHALLAPATDLLVGDGRRLCGDNEQARGDSATGTQQGFATSSSAFCIAIQPELAALDEELAFYGGCARAIMDDVYAIGPAEAVFAAIRRFGAGVEDSLRLEMNPSKLACWSRSYDLVNCSWRKALGAPIGEVELTMERGVGGGAAEREREAA
jgi:hypothetical protein